MNNSILSNIKIVEYNEIYSKSVNDFVNLSMHTFIGRPFKQREDLIDIKNYYIANDGNFWIAIDGANIVGTIALENRKSYGILKPYICFVDNL